MVLKDLKYQTIKDIEKEYDGHCVAIIRCKEDNGIVLGGEVLMYGESVADLVGKCNPILNNYGVDECFFRSFIRFENENSSVMDVIYNDN